MANKDDSGNFWWDKLLIPITLLIVGGIITFISAKDAPWWVSFSSDTTPSPTVTLDPTPTLDLPAPEPAPTPTPAAASISASQEIRKQGYIFRLQACHTTGEVGAVACDFTVEAESERKDIQIRALDTLLNGSNDQFYFASRIDFGSGGNHSSAHSDLIPGNPVGGTASFQGIPPGVSSFRRFEIDGHIYREGKLTATFTDVPLVD